MNDVTVHQRSVLWLSYPFPPAMSAGVFRSVRFVKYLPEFGWKPLVFTVTPDEYFPTDDSLADYLSEDLIVESSPIWRPGQWKRRLLGTATGKGANGHSSLPEAQTPTSNSLPTPQKQSLYRELRQRLLATPDEKIWWARPAYYKALKFIRKHGPAAIFSTSPPHSSHMLGMWLHRKTGLPLVLDFRDPWTRSPWSVPQSGYIESVHRKLEGNCVAAADSVILNTEPAQREFQEHYTKEPAKKFRTICNGFDPELAERVKRIKALESKRNNKVYKLCHVGTVYGRREMRPLLKAIASLVSNGISIEFTQLGALRIDYDLEAFLGQHGLIECVDILPPAPHEVALECMAKADALLLLQPDGELQIPGKLFEMILFSKPILTLTGQGATSDIARQFGLGPVADPSNPDEIAGAITSLLSNSLTDKTDWELVQSAFDGRNQTWVLANILDEVAGTRTADKVSE